MPLHVRLDSIIENQQLGRWGALLERHPKQLNRIHEADAELLPLPDGDNILAITTDTIAEEISTGLYQNPETIGWMAAVVSLSDLSAVGAVPLGLVVSVTLPEDKAAEWQEGIGIGLSEACRRMNTFVLGGDTNTAQVPSITSCAVGSLPRERPVTRMGARPGQRLYVSGGLGAGSCQAASAFLGIPEDLYSEQDFRPRARIDMVPVVSEYACCCIDTSDGLIGSLDQLMRLNGVGFRIETPIGDALDAKSRELCAALGLPEMVMPAGYHGEFELALTVDEDRAEAFELASRKRGLSPAMLGHVIAEPEIRVAGRNEKVIDGTRIRNLLTEVGGDIGAYLQTLLTLL